MELLKLSSNVNEYKPLVGGGIGGSGKRGSERNGGCGHRVR